MDVKVIGIAGGSASGKTTVSRALHERLGDQAALLLHDRYYRTPPPDVPAASWNYDHPDALETELLVAHVDALRRGQVAELPLYDFATHSRSPGVERVEPRPVLLVEGILVLADAALRERMDHTIFVHTPADVRLMRRLRRDVAERGRDPLGVLRQYEDTVRPMHARFVEPSRNYADLVLDGTQEVQNLVSAVLGLAGLTPAR